MAKLDPTHLSRRERQIMDALYELGRATAADVRERLPDPPSYSAVRAMLRRLEEKGHIRHVEQGPRYLFSPRLPRRKAQESAMSRLVQTFFYGSVAQAVTGLLGMSHGELSTDEIERLKTAIDEARDEGARRKKR